MTAQAHSGSHACDIVAPKAVPFKRTPDVALTREAVNGEWGFLISGRFLGMQIGVLIPHITFDFSSAE